MLTGSISKLIITTGLAVGLAVAVPGTAAGRAAAPPAKVRFLAFNICGSICNEGETARPGRGNDVVEHVRDVLVEHDPHIAVLNEVCEAQFHRLRALLRRGGHFMAGAFHAQRTADSRCAPVDGRSAFGDAVLATGPVGPAEVHPLPNRPSGGERRSLLCLPSTVGGRRLVACGLHLVAADREWNDRQLAAVVRHVGRRPPSTPVVVAGDFNRTPWEMGALTDARRGGRFVEVDAQNRPTHGGRKIDYILLDRNVFTDLAATVRPSPWSDHRVLLGWTSLQR